MADPSNITIVGAGMGGCLMSIYLARKGQQVELLERRPDPKVSTPTGGRSINLTLATRGIEALDEVGLKDEVLDLTVPLNGRMVHTPNGATEYQPYGNRSHEMIYSIDRNVMNGALIEAVEREPNVRLRFDQACLGLDKRNRRLILRDEVRHETFEKEPEMVIGADGVFSTVRRSMHEGEFANKSQEFLDWGYKELVIPPAADGGHRMVDDVLHIWPQGEGLLLAMPNPDGSFTGTLCLPFQGPNSFASLSSEDDLYWFCRRHYPDAVEIIPGFVEKLSEVPVSGFLTLKTDPWYFEDWVVLLGDACHTVLPFYGQGMNAAFEDCSYLARHLPANGDREELFRRYQQDRKCHTDALAMLSKKNFVELRAGVKSPLVGYRKKADLFLNRCFPERWIPLYTLISHSTVPYAEAVERSERQARILRWTGVDMVLRTSSLMTRVARSIRGRLAPRRGGDVPEPVARPKPVLRQEPVSHQEPARPRPVAAASDRRKPQSTIGLFLLGVAGGALALARLAGNCGVGF